MQQGSPQKSSVGSAVLPKTTSFLKLATGMTYAKLGKDQVTQNSV